MYFVKYSVHYPESIAAYRSSCRRAPATCALLALLALVVGLESFSPRSIRRSMYGIMRRDAPRLNPILRKALTTARDTPSSTILMLEIIDAD